MVYLNQTDYPFELFSPAHLFMLGATFLLLCWMYLFRERIRRKYKRPFVIVLILLLVLSEVTFHLLFLWNDCWDAAIHLPFQLSSISLYLCTFMLITKNYRLFEVSFFVSMTSASLAIVTPELFYGFPHLRFFQFFSAHIAVILACFYMVWIERFRPTFRSVIRAFVSLNGIAVVVFSVNQLLGSNYMFLARKPSNASPMDYLGPYPWYLLSLEGIAFSLFTLIFFIVKWSEKRKNSLKQ
ncbi:TIGR02206 family membrane protein [Bacillus tianshenii]|nr:TIGR02206 family membrane protein [Bacillus tianshenii]